MRVCLLTTVAFYLLHCINCVNVEVTKSSNCRWSSKVLDTPLPTTHTFSTFSTHHSEVKREGPGRSLDLPGATELSSRRARPEPFLRTALSWDVACMTRFLLRWDRPQGSEHGTKRAYQNETETWRTLWESFAKSRYSLVNSEVSEGCGSRMRCITNSRWNPRTSWEQVMLGDLAGRWCLVPWWQGAGPRYGPFSRNQCPISGRVSGTRNSETQSHRDWSDWQETNMDIQA